MADHSKSERHSKTEHVQFSSPHCIQYLNGRKLDCAISHYHSKSGMQIPTVTQNIMKADNKRYNLFHIYRSSINSFVILLFFLHCNIRAKINC